MDIAAVASVMKYSEIRQEASVSVAKMVMDLAELQADNLDEMLEQVTRAMELSINPHLGGNIDISI